MPFAPRRLAPLALACTLLISACASRPSPALDDPAAIAANNSEAIRLAAEGDRLRDQSRWGEAEERYRQALAKRGDLGAAWNNLGLCLMNQGNRLDALQAYHRAAELLPNDPRPMENIGVCYHEAGWDEDAISYFSKALDRDSRWLPAYRGLAISAQRLSSSSDTLRDQLRQGILIETDPKWRELMTRQLIRVEADLKDTLRGTPKLK